MYAKQQTQNKHKTQNNNEFSNQAKPLNQNNNTNNGLGTAQNTKPKQDFKYYIGRYISHIIINSGTTSKGKIWNKAMILVRNDYGDKTFKTFIPFNFKDSLQVDELIRGNIYKITYVQEPFTDNEGNEKKSNKILRISLENNNQVDEKKVSSMPPPHVPSTQPQPEDNEEYEEECSQTQQPLNKLTQHEIDVWNTTPVNNLAEWITEAMKKGLTVERAIIIDKEMTK